MGRVSLRARSAAHALGRLRRAVGRGDFFRAATRTKPSSKMCWRMDASRITPDGRARSLRKNRKGVDEDLAAYYLSQPHSKDQVKLMSDLIKRGKAETEILLMALPQEHWDRASGVCHREPAEWEITIVRADSSAAAHVDRSPVPARIDARRGADGGRTTHRAAEAGTRSQRRMFEVAGVRARLRDFRRLSPGVRRRQMRRYPGCRCPGKCISVCDWDCRGGVSPSGCRS